MTLSTFCLYLIEEESMTDFPGSSNPQYQVFLEWFTTRSDLPIPWNSVLPVGATLTIQPCIIQTNIVYFLLYNKECKCKIQKKNTKVTLNQVVITNDSFKWGYLLLNFHLTTPHWPLNHQLLSQRPTGILTFFILPQVPSSRYSNSLLTTAGRWNTPFVASYFQARGPLRRFQKRLNDALTKLSFLSSLDVRREARWRLRWGSEKYRVIMEHGWMMSWREDFELRRRVLSGLQRLTNHLP